MLKVIVNGKEHKVPAAPMTYRAAVQLANNGRFNENTVYTVTYSRADHDKSGILSGSQTVRVKKGMIINVAVTSGS